MDRPRPPRPPQRPTERRTGPPVVLREVSPPRRKSRLAEQQEQTNLRPPYEHRRAVYKWREFFNILAIPAMIRDSYNDKIPTHFSGVETRDGKEVHKHHIRRSTRGFIRLGAGVVGLGAIIFIGKSMSSGGDQGELPPSMTVAAPEPSLILDSTSPRNIYIDPFTSEAIQIGGQLATDNEYILTPEQQATARRIDLAAPPSVTTTTVAGVPGSAVPTTAPIVVVRPGESGQAVLDMQTSLEAIGCDLGPDGKDGNYGPSTKIAVGMFQSNMELSVDYLYGPDSVAANQLAIQLGSTACGADI